MSRPFLKWPGGKQWLIRSGVSVPTTGSNATYFEPFVGAGSLYFALAPSQAVLSDINASLVATYRGLKADPERIISGLKALSGDRVTFEEVKRQTPNDDVEAAVRMVFLNRTAFAGLYRENRRGEFNVPYGNYTDRRLCQENVLRSAGGTLSNAAVQLLPFAEAVASARAGDFVYFDPPYVTRVPDSKFIRYNSRLFTWNEQVALAALAHKLADGGVHVLVSSSAHDSVIDLYPEFEVTLLKRRSQVSRDVAARVIIQEAFYSSYRMS